MQKTQYLNLLWKAAKIILPKRLMNHHLDPRIDIYIISYPKCGSTWLRFIIGKAIEYHYSIRTDNPMDTKKLTLLCQSRSIEVPCIKGTHDGVIKWTILEKMESDKTKYRDKKVIFLVRDPRDVLVSSYYQKKKRRVVSNRMKGKKAYNGSIDDLIEDANEGVRSITTFYNIWANSKNTPRDFMLLRYEDMQNDTYAEIRKVFDFFDMKNIPEGVIRRAIEFCSFENMRKMERDRVIPSERLLPGNPDDLESYKTRKGKVGGYKEEMSKESIEKMNKIIQDELSDFYAFYK